MEIRIINLLSGYKDFKKVGEIERIPRQHSGWYSVTYKGKRYVLRGGIRTDEFINIDNPIRNKRTV